MEALFADRRERFKKSKNPLEFIHYYTKKNKLHLSEAQDDLIDKIVQLKVLVEAMDNFQLEKVLK